MIIPSRRYVLPLPVAGVAALGGLLVALHYHRLGLTLSHYDARGHLVVARRILDSLTPGWQQIGAVWLPLPHLLNALPVQIDFSYRTGASAVAISIAAFALATGAIAWIVGAIVGSEAAALASAAVFAFNPNVLYLQATPMTEPLMLGMTLAAVAASIEWVNRRARASTAGWALALACLTRYEAWAVVAATLVTLLWARWRRGEPMRLASAEVAAVAVGPLVVVIGFVIFSRVVIGDWFVASGFFVAENKSLGKPVLATAEIWWGTHALSSYVIVAVAALGLSGLLGIGLLSRRRADALVALSLVATALVPWAAFVKGHPFRIRYIVPLLAAEAIGAGVAVALAGRARRLAAALLLLVAGYELHPLDAHAPVVVEAQWDRSNVPVRWRVTDCLRTAYTGDTIMASMGSLGHYMQEVSRDGIAIREFLHEGNGDIWLAALDGPRPYAGWVLIEEKAEGGDMLAERARANPHFLDGYTRMCEGAGLALYHRVPKNPEMESER